MLSPTELRELCEGRALQWSKVAILRRLLAEDAARRRTSKTLKFNKL